MDAKKEKIIATIAKCLILSKDESTTEAERESAKSMAARMMAKHRISETEVDLDTDNFVMDSFDHAYDGPACAQWVGRVASLFSYLFDTKVVYRDKPWEECREYEIIGTFSDVETVLYFCEVAIHHISVGALEAWDADRNWRKRQQFGNHAVDALWERAWELKAQMDSAINEQEGCTDLVIRKTDEINSALEELYPNMKAGKSQKIDRADDAKTRNGGKKSGESCPLNFAIDEAA